MNGLYFPKWDEKSIPNVSKTIWETWLMLLFTFSMYNMVWLELMGVVSLILNEWINYVYMKMG